MRLLFIGCEWAGKHTLGIEVSRWWSEQTGESFLPPPHFSFHDHFVVPHVVHAMGHEHHKELSEKQMLTLNPGLLEHYQRYQIYNKLTPGYIDEPDLFLMDWYYGEAVYAPLYYGYGSPGEYADRRMLARWIDEDVLKLIPDTILVLIKASPEVIRERMAKGDSPFPGRHKDTYFRAEDAEQVLELFQEQYEVSLIRRKMEIDTTNASVDESLQKFISQVAHFVTDADRLRILTHRSSAIDWL
jgi:hypothetical protein